MPASQPPPPPPPPRPHAPSHTSPQPCPRRAMPAEADVSKVGTTAAVQPATRSRGLLLPSQDSLVALPAAATAVTAAASSRASSEGRDVRDAADVPPFACPSRSPSPYPAPVGAAPTTRRLCVLASGVLFFHVLTSALQERIFHLPGFTNVLLLSGGETFCTMALAACLLVWRWWRAGMPVRASAAAAAAAAADATAVIRSSDENEEDESGGESTASSSPTLSGHDSRPLVPAGILRNRDRATTGVAGSGSSIVSTHNAGACAFAGSGDAPSAAATATTGGRADPHRSTEPSHLDMPASHARSFAAPLRRGGTHVRLRSARACLRGGRGTLVSTICDIFHPSTVRVHWYMRIAVLVSCSLYLTNRTSLVLSYAMQVIFKSSKLLCMILVHRWWTRSRAIAAPPHETTLDGHTSRRSSVVVKGEGGGGGQEEAEDGEGDEGSAAVDGSGCCARHTGNPIVVQVDEVRFSSSASSSRSSCSSSAAPPPLHPPASAARRDVFCADRGPHPLSSELVPPSCLPTTTTTTTTTANISSAAVVVSAAAAASRTPLPCTTTLTSAVGAPAASPASSSFAEAVDDGAEAGVRRAARLGHAAGDDSTGATRFGGSSSVRPRWWRWVPFTSAAAAASTAAAGPTRRAYRHGSGAALAGWVHRAMTRVSSTAPPRRGDGGGDAHGFECTAQRGLDRDGTRAGYLSRAAVWLRRQASRLLHDTEMLACIVIVLGLIAFTYASELERRASAATVRDAAELQSVTATAIGTPRADTGGGTPNAAAAAAEMADPVATARVSAVLRAVLQLVAAGSLTTASASPTSAAAVWAATVVGVVGVLLSNVLDAVMYILEEVHCFHADADTPADAAASTSRVPPGTRVWVDGEGDDARARHATTAAVPQTVGAVRHGTGAHERSAAGPAACSPPRGGGSVSSSTPCTASGTYPPEHPGAVCAADAVPDLAEPRAPTAAVPATSLEVLFMVNGFATLLYTAGMGLSWCYDLVHPTVAALTAAELRELGLCEASVVAQRATHAETAVVLSKPCRALVTRHHDLLQRRQSPLVSTTVPVAEGFSLATFVCLIALASVTSMVGTLCLLRIIAEYTGVMAVVVTSARKTATILLSFLIYRRRFTVLHGLGLASVMGGVVCYEMQRRRAGGHRGKR